MGKGNSLMYFTATQVSYPAYATSPYSSRLVNAATVRQADIINFIAAPGDNEWVYFSGKMPMFFAMSNGIDVYIYWTASTAAADDVIWGAGWENVADEQLITSDNFSPADDNTVTDTGNAGGADYLQICSISFTASEIAELTAGTNFRLKVYRDTDDAGDDHAGIAQLHAVELREGL